MKNTYKSLLAFLYLVNVSTVSFAGSDEFKMFPVFTDDAWKPKMEIAAVVGHMDVDRSSVKNRPVYGLELSFECPVFTIPGENTIRQQLELSQSDKHGLRITTIEINPYYHIALSEDLVFGFGPGIGGMHADPDGNKDQWLFSVQVGAGVKYYIDDFIIGADLRRQWTAEKDLGSGSKEDLDNTRLLLKAGYRF